MRCDSLTDIYNLHLLPFPHPSTWRCDSLAELYILHHIAGFVRYRMVVIPLRNYINYIGLLTCLSSNHVVIPLRGYISHIQYASVHQEKPVVIPLRNYISYI